jgi:hypothetical protein
MPASQWSCRTAATSPAATGLRRQIGTPDSQVGRRRWAKNSAREHWLAWRTMHRRRLVSVLDDDGLRGDLKPHLLERFSFHPPHSSLTKSSML